MAKMDWKLRENGDVELFPVTGWHVVLAGGVIIALQLQCYSTERQRQEQSPVPIQFGLSPTDALQFAAALREVALQALNDRPADRPN